MYVCGRSVLGVCTLWTQLALLGQRPGGETQSCCLPGLRPGTWGVPWGRREVSGELPRPRADDEAKAPGGRSQDTPEAGSSPCVWPRAPSPVLGQQRGSLGSSGQRPDPRGWACGARVRHGTVLTASPSPCPPVLQAQQRLDHPERRRPHLPWPHTHRTSQFSSGTRNRLAGQAGCGCYYDHLTEVETEISLLVQGQRAAEQRAEHETQDHKSTAVRTTSGVPSTHACSPPSGL